MNLLLHANTIRYFYFLLQHYQTSCCINASIRRFGLKPCPKNERKSNYTACISIERKHMFFCYIGLHVRFIYAAKPYYKGDQCWPTKFPSTEWIILGHIVRERRNSHCEDIRHWSTKKNAKMSVYFGIANPVSQGQVSVLVYYACKSNFLYVCWHWSCCCFQSSVDDQCSRT